MPHIPTDSCWYAARSCMSARTVVGKQTHLRQLIDVHITCSTMAAAVYLYSSTALCGATKYRTLVHQRSNFTSAGDRYMEARAKNRLDRLKTIRSCGGRAPAINQS